MNNSEQTQHSRLRTRKVRDFFYHLIVYVFIMAMLFSVSGTGGALIWMSLIWGFAVALHAVYAFLG